MTKEENLIGPVHWKADQQASNIKWWNCCGVHHNYEEYSNELSVSIFNLENRPHILVFVVFLYKMLCLPHITRATSIPAPAETFQQPEHEISPWYKRIEVAGDSNVYPHNSIPFRNKVLILSCQNRAILREFLFKDLRCWPNFSIDYKDKKCCTYELNWPHLGHSTS